jgi:hypothetical protein
VHLTLQPHCASNEFCAPVQDALVPPVTNASNGQNDYIYVARSAAQTFSYDWTLWVE